MRKMKTPNSALIISDITLYTANRRTLTVLRTIPVVVTVRGNIDTTARQLLHTMSKLSALFIRKTYLQEIHIISDSFALPAQLGKAVDAISITGSSPPPSPLLLCGCPVRNVAPAHQCQTFQSKRRTSQSCRTC